MAGRGVGGLGNSRTIPRIFLTFFLIPHSKKLKYAPGQFIMTSRIRFAHRGAYFKITNELGTIFLLRNFLSWFENEAPAGLLCNSLLQVFYIISCVDYMYSR